MLKRIVAGWSLAGVVGLVLLAGCTGVPEQPEPAHLDLGAASDVGCGRGTRYPTCPDCDRWLEWAAEPGAA